MNSKTRKVYKTAVARTLDGAGSTPDQINNYLNSVDVHEKTGMNISFRENKRYREYSYLIATSFRMF